MPDEVIMASGPESSDATSIGVPRGSEASLRQSREMLESILHAVPQAVFWKDCNGVYLGCNEIFAYWVGIDNPAQIVGKTDFDLPWPREQTEAYRDADREVVESKKPNQHIRESLRRADGVRLWIDTSKVPLIDEAGRVYGVLGMCEDVTARTQAEEKFTKAFVASPSVLAIIRLKDSCILDINDSFEKYTGYCRDEVIGHTALDLGVWDDVSKRNELYEELAAKGRVRNEECRFRVKNGDVLIGLTSVDIIEIDGETCGLVVIADITERRRAEERLRESEERFRSLFDCAPLGYQSLDGEGHFIDVNRAWLETLGYTYEEVVGKWFGDFLAPEFVETFRERFPQFKAAGSIHSEFQMLHKDGSRRFIAFEGRIGYKADGSFRQTHCILSDITDRKRGEKIQQLNGERTAVLLKLNQMIAATLEELTDFAMEMSIRMCESKIGYIAFLNDDESVLTMQSWSKSAMAECEVVDKPIVYPVVTTGLWGEAVRQRKAVITNDYAAPNPLKRGHPEGHIQIHRHMNIPVIVGSKIVLVAGVGNKEEPYDETDVQQLTLLMEGMWRLIERHRSEKELTQYRDHLEELVGERTKELESSRKEALNLMQDANVQKQRAEEALQALRQSEEQLRKSELELRVSNEHLARAQAVAHVGHWTWDLTTGRITGSEEYHRIRGTTPDKLTCYEDVLNTIHPDDREQWSELVKAAVAGERPYIGDYRIVLPDKTVKYLHVQGETTFDEHGKSACMFGAVFDVTDTRIAEIKLKEAMVVAETANRAKSLFLANMSHELRTPLTAVLGFSQLLRDDPSLTETQKENLDIINRSGAHLLALINDVLDISKIEAGQLGVQETVFSLSGVLESVEEMMRVRADAKGLRFHLDREPTLPRYIKADERKLKQVLINLAGNAVKFTQKGSVAVRVRMEDDGSVLRCDVEDTGPGIHSDDIPNLFDRFVQVGEDHEGVGLGLYISRKLVELMGGHITVESELEKGSRFSFTIRCVPGTIEETTPLASRRKVVGLDPGQPRRHILVVEDKIETRLLVVKMLQAVGFHVLEAENGHEAVKRFEMDHPDLILMDMRMPIMDGYRATRKIKATERGKATPIIALTASAFDEERQKTLAAGADDHLGKPIKVDELYEAIRVHLGIEYAYAEPEPVTPPACDRAGFSEMVATLPESVANRLAEAISALDLDRLMALLPEVSSHAPILAEHLTKLAGGYEITKLAELLETRSVS